MRFLQNWLRQRSRRKDWQKRVKTWNKTGDAELCLPQETVDLLATQEDIDPFWKTVLLSISDRVSMIVQTQTVTTNALLICIRDAHPNATGEEVEAIMSALWERAALATQKRDLENLLQR